jgi:MSHA biogenesis protein MshJ
MNPNWRAKWQQLEDKANALSVRERLIVAVATGVLLLGVFDQLLLRPWLNERAELNAQREQLGVAAEQANRNIATLEQQLANDPNRLLREKIAELNQRHTAADADIGKITAGMIAPELMPQLLGELLSERSGLSVQSIKTMPAEQVLSADKNDASAPAIYRHDMELRLEGGFAQAQNYLRSIEQLPSRVIWDELTFEVEKYPKGQLRLAVHTLSTREEFIRVSR